MAESTRSYSSVLDRRPIQIMGVAEAATEFTRHLRVVESRPLTTMGLGEATEVTSYMTVMKWIVPNMGLAYGNAPTECSLYTSIMKCIMDNGNSHPEITCNISKMERWLAPNMDFAEMENLGRNQGRRMLAAAESSHGNEPDIADREATRCEYHNVLSAMLGGDDVPFHVNIPYPGDVTVKTTNDTKHDWGDWLGMSRRKYASLQRDLAYFGRK